MSVPDGNRGAIPTSTETVLTIMVRKDKEGAREKRKIDKSGYANPDSVKRDKR